MRNHDLEDQCDQHKSLEKASVKTIKVGIISSAQGRHERPEWQDLRLA